MKAATIIKIGSVQFWSHQEFAKGQLTEYFKLLKQAVLNFIKKEKDSMPQSTPINSQESNHSECSADVVCYSTLYEEESVNNDEALTIKFEEDLDKEISAYREYFINRDVIRSVTKTKHFWLKNQIVLPILFSFAIRVMNIAISSAYIERYFSVCGVVCTTKSFNMKDDLVIIRSLLKANYKLLIEMRETLIDLLNN